MVLPMTCQLQTNQCILLTKKTIGRSLFKDLTIVKDANKLGNKQTCASGVDKKKAWGGGSTCEISDNTV